MALPRVPNSTEEARVVGALEELLARFPDPAVADRDAFLRVRYDLGLGWLQFESGFGGLGVAASWQRVVESRLRPLRTPTPGSGDFVGMHQAAASINAVGTHEQKARFLPAIFRGAGALVPAVQRAGRRFRPRRALHDGGAGWRGMGRAGSEGVDERRPWCAAGRFSWRAPILTSRSTAA